MASSTTTGDRRWASTRRGGMTVLGKVAVPKPINLPSQRLENHGLDPNVEIVPKGTLSWGSRPSSSGSNAWGTSALSPSTDGSSSSPSHLAGRPSSGGGSRPSTASSEKAHDSNFSAWGSNSRPSSASGVLASNHASLTPLRPRSAETRPGSSQLSRFAEPLPESSAAWAAAVSSEQKGVAAPGNDGFSLSSGDFPTLGSDKDEPRKNTEPLDHAFRERPGSSSGGVTTMTDSMAISHGDAVFRNTDIRGTSWMKGGPPYVEDGPRPSIERWHGEPHPYTNPNMAPHYESWRGAPPVNPPGGIWYRGPPGPPPYGTQVAPGGFPVKPFPYYRPHVPAPSLANSQPIPLPGPGPHGHHPKNGDMYRPLMPDSYMRPGMPIRPGFYPGPVPYDGYYRPPMGFCNPNERDVSFMGVTSGPPVYNRHRNLNGPDPNDSHTRSGEGRGPDQVEPGHPHNPRGNYKVLMKQNDGWDRNDEENWGHRVPTCSSNHEKGILSNSSVRENAWGDDYKQDEDMHYATNASVKEISPPLVENKSGSTDLANAKLPGSVSNVHSAENPVVENVVSPRDHSLIQKIEGLNAKARTSVGRQDGFHREEPHDRVQIVCTMANHSAVETISDVALERHFPTGVLVPVSRDINIATVDESRESAVAGVTAASRRAARGVQSRSDHHEKGRSSGQEADAWRKKSVSESGVSAAGSRSTTDDQVEEHLAVVQPADVPKPNVERKDDGLSVMSTFDPSDAQRAKMREMAKQRAIQLQKEEEERTREQKAKALAKLEELNRRSSLQDVENSSRKLESIPLQNASNQPEPSFDAHQSAGSSSASSNSSSQTNESARKALDSSVSSRHLSAETKKNVRQDSDLLQKQSTTADVNCDDAVDHKTTPQVREVPKQKRVGYKVKQNVSPEENFSQDVLENHKDTSSTQEVTDSVVALGAGKELADLPQMFDSQVHQKKKNKSGKTKHKVEESSTALSVSIGVPKDSDLARGIPEPGKAEQSAPNLNMNSSAIKSSGDAKDAMQPLENRSSSSSQEDAQGRLNNSSKPQHSRKPRNSQVGKFSDKSHSNDAVVWAPVRSHDKVEVTGQTSQKAAEGSVSSPTEDNGVHHGSRTKRAELERYVPKPVAKELAQQGSIQQSASPSVDQSETDEKGRRLKASQGSDYVGKGGSTMESKHVDGKHRHPRAQGSWRQRVSSESIPVQTSQDISSIAANNSKNIQTSYASPQDIKSDDHFVRGSPSRPDEHLTKGPQAGISDGWNDMNNLSSTSSAALAGVKDNVPSGRGKRHPFKGNKGSGNNLNLDNKDSNAALNDLQCPPVEISQTERTTSSRENRAAGDRSKSHWQPKSHGSSAFNKQGSMSNGDHNSTAEDSKALPRETGHNSDSHLVSRHTQGPAEDQMLASKDKDGGGGMTSSGHQETKRDNKAAPFKGRSHSPDQGPSGVVEPVSSGATGEQTEQRERPSSGYRKHANYGGRFNRGHESHGDWNSRAPENKQHYVSKNRERQRQNPHYEYQPVGPYTNSGRSNESGQQTEIHSGGSRFKERGQGTHSRRGRGNYHGRQSGNPTDSGQE